MKNKDERDCSNCHIDRIPYVWEAPCYHNPKGCGKWTPLLNIDRVHEMSEEELVRLWGSNGFEAKYVPDCGSECKWTDFVCDCCPETFRNWLRGEVEA